jgi:hypothetical protein
MTVDIQEIYDVTSIAGNPQGVTDFPNKIGTSISWHLSATHIL